jgi:hypothetical protein
MTAFSQTVRNNLFPFSNATPVLWGSMVWGTDAWGANSYEQRQDVIHYVVASGPVMTSTVGPFNVVHQVVASGPVLTSAKGPFDAVHYVTADGPVLTDLTARQWTYTVSVTGPVFSSDPSVESLTDGNGYSYMFGNQSNAENRVLTTFTSGTPVDVTWTVGATTSTVWS